ncbi:MAG TPA: AMP-binding protein [Micromonosporaceae bacterium]
MRTVVDAIIDKEGGTGTLTMLGDGSEIVATAPWRDVYERARRLASVLARHGLKPGGRVGLLGDTSIGLVTAIQAVWFTGAAITIMPAAGRGGQSSHLAYLRSITTDAAFAMVIADDDLVETAAALNPKTRVYGLSELCALADDAPLALAHRPDPADLAVLQYTSGSTRAPRGVPVTHAHLAANVAAIKVALRHEASHPSRMMSWLPLYHDMGLIGFFIMPMSCGCDLLLQSPFGFARRPAAWLETMARHQVTMSGAPNFAYALMTRLLRAGFSADLRSVRCLISGGEPVDAGMMSRFVAAAAPLGLDPTAIVPAYGLAESTLCATVSPIGSGLLVDWVDPNQLECQDLAAAAPPGAGARPLVRVGPAVAGVELRIVDRITGAPVGERMVGQVELRGASVVGHYWGEPAPVPGSWLPTGDLGYLIEGELVVCGRQKDVLFAAGRNIYPQDIEAVAAEVPGVRAGGAVAFGLITDRGDRLVVAVEAREPARDDLGRAITAAVLGEVGLTPSDVVVVAPGRLPKTSSGKLRRAEARRQYLAGELRSPDYGEDNDLRNRVLELESR